MKHYEKFKNDNAESWLYGLIVVIVLIGVFVFALPTFCNAAPPTPEGWGLDFCSMFRN